MEQGIKHCKYAQVLNFGKKEKINRKLKERGADLQPSTVFLCSAPSLGLARLIYAQTKIKEEWG